MMVVVIRFRAIYSRCRRSRQAATRRPTHAPAYPPAVAPAAIVTAWNATMRERSPQWDDDKVGLMELAETAVRQLGASTLRMYMAAPTPPRTTPAVAPINVARRCETTVSRTATDVGAMCSLSVSIDV
jgi:hypothetical protein